MKKKILLFARDPGGANTILSLVEAMQDRGYELLLYGKETALKRYQHFGLQGMDITCLLEKIDAEHWQEFLERERPDFIITGTSGDDFSERTLWKAAAIMGIPSFAILDQWINYGLRFSPYGLNQKDQYEKERQHPFLPDRILVMDEEARQEMIKTGIEAKRILVSGQPYFDLLLRQQKEDHTLQNAQTRQALQIAPNDYVLFYVSESIRQDYSVASGEMPYWGYDEISILKELLQVLQPIIREETRPVYLLIKKHPLERSDSYWQVLQEMDCGNLKVQVVDGNVDSGSLVLASDLICGMSSMLLLESVLLGKPTLSIQIGLRRESPFILDKKGVLTSILNRQDLEEIILKMMQGDQFTCEAWTIGDGAIDKVIQLMEAFLCQN